METIEFKISPDGSEVKVEGKGFKGDQCLSNDVAKGVLKALGETTSEKKKDEYFSHSGAGQSLRR